MLSETLGYLSSVLLQCTEAKKHCWYFEGLYPTYYICRSYEDCCGSRCCVRALSIQRLWYFWFLLMMGVLFCCGAGFFIRRRMYPPPLIEEPAFNVSYTRQPPNPGPDHILLDDRDYHLHLHAHKVSHCKAELTPTFLWSASCCYLEEAYNILHPEASCPHLTAEEHSGVLLREAL
ncbi:WW domain binding protein VOPP1 isoform X2 [Homo sapiens]|uniref:WW domain binding protein VOPP1 isoform X2 n=1 Tax=Homo sapiens TaxID=9606 RepID=UPI0005D034E1|nr:WW domain binding protein VOPP1 isoform X2 [Homo sapiens]XP_054215060.1 WW domain binding protein VOPP1 isoform X2 [Homo sapiens]|eukprot:XP_011513842.1 vesicular, overexpressed in cancer, prosurvival protein 1 isoform X2 [Homo sapiens]